MQSSIRSFLIYYFSFSFEGQTCNSSFWLFAVVESLGAKQEDGKYKHTVDLPKTTFGMRANSLVREPEIQKIWDDNQVYKRVVDRNNGVSFVVFLGFV